MTHNPQLRPQLRLATALLVGASSLSLAAPAFAGDLLFSSKGDKSFEFGARVNQLDGLKQVRLDDGAVVSVLGVADYRIDTDGSVHLYAGSLTVAGGDGTTIVRMPDGVEGRIAGRASAATFSVGADGKGRGHVLTGAVDIGPADAPRRFAAGQLFAFAPGERAQQVVSNGAQATPAASDAADAPIADMRAGGPVAAAANGVPVTLGDALAAAGASSDVLAAARRVDAAVANPAIESFPSGDLALLVAGAAGLEHAYGGTPFPGAQADIIRTYLAHLAAGRSGADFLTAYAGFLGQYLDLLRSNAAPSSFGSASLADINAFIAYAGCTGRLGQLGAQDRVLADAYLAFLQGGGSPDRFGRNFTDLTAAYFAFIRGGGNPADFGQASAATIDAYIRFLADSGLVQRLRATDRALLAAYLGNGGIAFAAEYRAALDAYFAFLASGRLPSAYGALDAATLRSYLETLADAGLLDTVAGDRAAFYSAYLAFLRGGGAPDAFAGLPANIFAGYANQLDAYFAFLAAGNLPSDYDGADIEQLRAYLAALQAGGALDRFLGDRTEFFAAYLAFLQGGGQPNAFPGLNANIFAGYADALAAYYAYLANGGVPSAYGALTQETIRAYIAALQGAGASNAFLAELAGFYSDYFAFLAGGGNPDNFAGLPVPPDFAAFAAALNAYAAFLAAGGLPADYDAQQLATLETYLASITGSGQAASLLGANADLLNAYFAYLAGGGTPNGFSGLPIYSNYVSALNAYYAFLAGGGLPADYTALTPAQIRAYLSALNGAGGFASHAGLDAFFTGYFAFIAGGGNPAQFAGLPVYADYVTALNAYYAFLAAGGLPTEYTALTQAQISAYLAALNGAGGFTSHAGLDAFFAQYYAFLAAGGDPVEYGGLPVYSDYLAAVQAYYSFLLGGGRPSEYTALTPEQIETYLALLDGAGVLDDRLSGPILAFLTGYLAYLETGGDPDQFAGLPDPGGPDNPQYAGGFPSGTTGARAYAVHAGVSYQASATPQLDADGVLTDAGDLGIGTAQAVDVAGDASVVVGRYVDGAPRFRGFNNDVGANGGIPWVVTAPLTTPLPTSGTIDYDVLAATKPVFASGRAAPGTFDANLTIGFDASSLSYGFDGTIVMPEAGGNVRYDFASEGRADGALVSTFGVNPVFNMNGKMTGNGDACSSDGCLILFYGGFGGSADRVGMTYQTIDNPNFQTAERIQGAVAFAATGSGGPGPDPDPEPQPEPGIATGQYENQYLINLTYANFDAQYRSKVTYDDAGVLVGWTRDNGSPQGVQRPGPAGESGSVDGVIGWTRWLDTNNFGLDDPNLANSGNPILSGTFATALPTTGRVDYALVGATRPTDRLANLAPGSFTGSVAVDFATKRVGFDFDIGIDQYGWNVKTAGGAADPNNGGYRLTGNNEIDGLALISGTTAASCTATCSSNVRGALFGPGATHFGAAYTVNDAGAGLVVSGVAAFAGQPAAPTNPYARMAPGGGNPVAATAAPTTPLPAGAPAGTGSPPPASLSADWGRWAASSAGTLPVAAPGTPALPTAAPQPGDAGDLRQRAERLLGGLVSFKAPR
ncbi:hypothetical protein [Sphingopyxis macrogoltabida]|uniref:DUF4214 domain-containing protein n=1 Tax=Sphingopyxis macrogoltabida TaxID=33050 RepID=A0AAC9AWR2_SPHMC|nr:hypothetical protein [Sphingopyxis macrogoltabida]ALJ14837.1 hypothetical protein LH19_18360 [Sphingopyxis macrogoltabida]AMU91089.1 hypothetical protein ATM17_18925 [Sphingopyxis macrogoltabida]